MGGYNSGAVACTEEYDGTVWAVASAVPASYKWCWNGYWCTRF